MIETFINFIQTHLIPLGGMGVFIASIIEEIIAIIPSAIVIFTSGFLLVSGPVSFSSIFSLFIKVALPASLGIAIGSLFVYSIAYFAGKPILVKWGKWLGLSWADIEKVQEKFSKTSFDELSLFAVRAIPVVPSVVISAFCGLVRFPVKSFLVYSFLGLLIRTMILGFIGWQAGKFYFKYANVVSTFEDIILWAVVAGAILFVVWRVYKRKTSSTETISSISK